MRNYTGDGAASKSRGIELTELGIRWVEGKMVILKTSKNAGENEGLSNTMRIVIRMEHIGRVILGILTWR